MNAEIVNAPGGGTPLRPALPVVLPVVEVLRENAGARTLFVPRAAGGDQRSLTLGQFVPGRFFMLWIPRMDEKPYAVSYLDEDRLGITVQQRGPFSNRLCEMKPGEQIGLRGPYGRGFRDLEGRGEGVALVGGGCGVAVLALLKERLPEATLVQGARSEDFLFFRRRFPDQLIFTDDGSAGQHGFPTEWLQEQCAGEELKAVYTCGPEAMMARVASICREHQVKCQVSLERYMKCGIGVCGQCDCDGRRVCVEGPTFSLEELSEMPSFGRRKRDKTGRIIQTAGGEGVA